MENKSRALSKPESAPGCLPAYDGMNAIDYWLGNGKQVARVVWALPVSRVLSPTVPAPSVNCWSLSRSKRTLDLSLAFVGLVVCAVPMLIVALCIRLSSQGPALFAQKRVGRGGRLFTIFKFRTMTAVRANKGPRLTKEGDCRITPLGRWLRKLKIDELPQFLNVLHGDMSFVGPRPKLPQFAAVLDTPFRPGITGAASFAFRNEEGIMAGLPPEELEGFYISRIKPLKARIDSRYMRRATFWTDLRMIVRTVLTCVVSTSGPPVWTSSRIKEHAVLTTQDTDAKEALRSDLCPDWRIDASSRPFNSAVGNSTRMQHPISFSDFSAESRTGRAKVIERA